MKIPVYLAGGGVNGKWVTLFNLDFKKLDRFAPRIKNQVR